MSHFPADFLWGAATSSHQVEGGNDGNDWWDWEREPGRIRDGTRSGEACGWWEGRAEEDLDRAAAMGHTAHRMSVEWSRLEPAPGEWDGAAFARYADIIGHARGLGMKVMVTVHHFSLPRWVAAQGGVTWARFPEALGRVSAEVARRLGQQVDLWCTINEPNVLAVAGYGSHHFPPGRDSALAAFSAMANLLRAHAASYAALKAHAPHTPVGLVLNLPRFEPARARNPLDRFAAWAQDRAFNEVFIEGLATGRLTFPLAALRREIPGLRRSADFVGVNYYGRLAVRFSLTGETPLGVHVQEPSIRTETNDWGQPWPEGLRAQVLRVHRRLGLPVYITENGVYDNEDALRPRFIVGHLRALKRAIAEGADVRGYFHWSLVDNFEWAEGWSTRFGLLALDRETGTRARRPSADLYARICHDNAVPDELPELP